MNILLGVTGGIAAYKAVEITSRLKKSGFAVKVIMTRAAQEFVAPRLFAEISGEDVVKNMWDEPLCRHTEHISLAKWADLIIVAPATANFIAKVAVGMADDMLTTVLLATNAPIIIAPAMNTDMYMNAITQRNIQTLKERGFVIITPDVGLLACGASGIGRLPEPMQIVDAITAFFDNKTNSLSDKRKLLGKKIIVTAGGTIAPIDPVRFIANKSSGKMGIAVAVEAAKAGADVVLITGNISVEPPKNIRTVSAMTTEEMHDVVLSEFSDAHAVIMTAAVADYRIKNIAPQKIKKSADSFTLELVKNPDILKELGQIKKTGQILVGFAAETENVDEYAKRKLVEKKLDFIVANDVSRTDAGFNTDTNAAVIYSAAGRDKEEFPLAGKDKLAKKIIERLSEYF